MSANYADGAVIMMPGDAAWTGRTTIEGKFRELLDGTTFTAARFATEDVLVGGDLAVERGAGTWTYTPKGGKPVTDRLKYLAVWRRQPDGSLRIIRDINNSDGPAGQ
jgi:ketosteroid isomerase-like protein